MSNYKLPGPGPSPQGPWDSSLMIVHNGSTRLMTAREEFMTRFHLGEYTKGFDSVLSNRSLLNSLCEDFRTHLIETPESDASYVQGLMTL